MCLVILAAMQRTVSILGSVGLLALTPNASITAQENAAPPPLIVESVRVEPARPAADTLCHLEVILHNRGDHTASQLDFRVVINGQQLPVYRNQLFMYPVAAGETATVQLYNFWSTETSRPMPTDGKLKVEVTLVEARWMDISVDDEGVEVWKPLGDVDGLPSRKQVVLTMSNS